MSLRFYRRNLAYQVRHYRDLPGQARDDVANEHATEIYFCPECEEEHPDDHTTCPRYPKDHDETGYMGTGPNYPDDVQALARLIADDD